MNNIDNSKKIIGRLELVSFPELGMHNVEAKIDTGADFGCINAKVIEVFEKDDSRYVKFTLSSDKAFILPVLQTNDVKSSNGLIQKRYIILTPMIIAGENISVKMGLSDRSDMKYQVLIGRKIIDGHFIVDVSAEFLASNKN